MSYDIVLSSLPFLIIHAVTAVETVEADCETEAPIVQGISDNK